MQLVLVAARRRAALQVAHVGAFVRYDQRALELSRALGVDAEVGRQLHRAAHALGNVAERSVGKDRGVQCGVEVVGIRNHRTQIFLYHLGILLYRLRDRAEYYALLGQRLAEGGLDRYRIHDGIDRHARQRHLLFERYAQLVECAFELGIDLVHRRELLRALGRGVVYYVLKVDPGDVEMRPLRQLHRLPVAERLQAAFEHPLRLALLFGDEPHHILVQPAADRLGSDIRRKAVLVVARLQLLDYIFAIVCHITQLISRKNTKKMQTSNLSPRLFGTRRDSPRHTASQRPAMPPPESHGTPVGQNIRGENISHNRIRSLSLRQ